MPTPQASTMLPPFTTHKTAEIMKMDVRNVDS
jgi:hypothetical protein